MRLWVKNRKIYNLIHLKYYQPMKIKIYIPQKLGENEMKDLVYEFGMDGEKIQYTDHTGGPDWIVQFINPASIYITGITSVFLLSFAKSIGKKLGENLGAGISAESAKLYNFFKNGIKNMLTNTNVHNRSNIPNMIFETENLTYVFRYGELNKKDYKLAEEALPVKLQQIMLELENNKQSIINDEHIGIVFVWHVNDEKWYVLSINAIDTYNQFSTIVWD